MSAAKDSSSPNAPNGTIVLGWTCCEVRWGNDSEVSVPGKCPPLPTGDWCTQQQHECYTPEELECPNVNVT